MNQSYVRYEGMEWDGRHWVSPDPVTGEMVPQRLTLISRLPIWGKVAGVAVATGVAVVALWLQLT